MNVRHDAFRARSLGPAEGFSLVVVLVMLGAIALGSAAALRRTSGSTQLTRVQLMRTFAYEQAYAGLLFCETQLLLPSASRVPTLAQDVLRWSTPAQPAWTSIELWRAGTTLTVAVQAADRTFGKPPVCLAEQQSLPGQGPGQNFYIVSARGFSPDYLVDSFGMTTAGAVVWLQSLLLIENAQVRERLWRRILNPPLR